MADKIIVPVENENGEFFLLLKDFAGFVNIKKVKFYEIKNESEDGFSLKFYDKNRKLVKLNVTK